MECFYFHLYTLPEKHPKKYTIDGREITPNPTTRQKETIQASGVVKNDLGSNKLNQNSNSGKPTLLYNPETSRFEENAGFGER